jgi:hypothetical protein
MIGLSRCHLLIAGMIAVGLGALRIVSACPYCSAVAPTLTEQFEESTIVVIAQLVEKPKPKPGEEEEGFFPGLGEELDPCKFRVSEVLKGADALGDTKEIEAVLFSYGDAKVGSRYLLSAIDGPPLVWAAPMALTDRSKQYILDLIKLPKKGVERLAFMQRHLENTDDLIMRDAYDEFAIASYDDLKALAPQIDHKQIVQWLENPELSASKKSLYLTMLSVCGDKGDLPMLEKMMKAQGFKTSLDATIGCYLALRGQDGLPLIGELFLTDVADRPTEAYAALRAIRLSHDEKLIDREATLDSLKMLLDHPKYADLVLADLARLQDWSVIDRASQLFATGENDNAFIRPSILRYLHECPLPEAKEKLAELEKLDPNAARQARASAALSGAASPPAKVPAGPPIKKPSADKTPAKKDAGKTQAQSADQDEDSSLADKAATANSPPKRQAVAASAASLSAETQRTWVVGVLVVVGLAMLVYGVLVARRKEVMS